MNPSSSLQYSAGLPAKRMAAGALLRRANGDLLLVKPTYRADWLLPGGSIEKDESPAQGCAREVREELGLNKVMLELLCLEYQSAHETGTESLQFIFDGGTLNEAEIAAIRLPAEELSEYRFCPREEALALLAGRLAERTCYALRALNEQRLIYLENQSETFR